MKKISAVYKITNTITDDFYIGSSKNVYRRWAEHKCPSTWKRCLNNPMYQDMQEYGVYAFQFDIIIRLDDDYMLKSTEQELIEYLKPTYNDRMAKGWDVERYKEPRRKAIKKYYDRLCSYNGETLTLNALRIRFIKAGIEHPTVEATKYLIEEK